MGVAEACGAPGVALGRRRLTDESELEALVSTTDEKFGKLDVLYNNAAQGDPSATVDAASAGFDTTIALLTRSALLGHKFASRQFQAQGTGASIITTASAAALQGEVAGVFEVGIPDRPEERFCRPGRGRRR